MKLTIPVILIALLFAAVVSAAIYFRPQIKIVDTPAQVREIIKECTAEKKSTAVYQDMTNQKYYVKCFN